MFRAMAKHCPGYFPGFMDHGIADFELNLVYCIMLNKDHNVSYCIKPNSLLHFCDNVITIIYLIPKYTNVKLKAEKNDTTLYSRNIRYEQCLSHSITTHKGAPMCCLCVPTIGRGCRPVDAGSI